MSVTLTEKAASHVEEFLRKRGKGVGLRVGVKTSGCSGMAYALEFADKIEPEDQVYESYGIKVIVDPKSLPYINGTELDLSVKVSILDSNSRTRTRKKAAAAASLSMSN